MPNQMLPSGIFIRQEIIEAVRFVFFDTECEEWPYATHGGTGFIVNYCNKIYAITCAHVRGDFVWAELNITNRKHGNKIAGISEIYYITSPEEEAKDSDIVDVVVVAFRDDVDANFFDGTAYIFNSGTIATSSIRDKIFVYGALKEKSSIIDGKIAPVYCCLEMQDSGPETSDTTLRHAIARFESH
ncbi:hypothetical protein [Magnetospirillum sp. SS-4]|uniref:hypothetical protein n=1 Tax=Magnetospirillum sp. SS-4 TaxID=2681465 RepID=UPI001573126A|nr:hypothetical protein [Magnetospirillum sp. SS-4]